MKNFLIAALLLFVLSVSAFANEPLVIRKQEREGWKAYTQTEGSTMIVDDELSLTYRHDDELIKLLMPDYEY